MSNDIDIDKVLELGLPLIKKWEGFRAEPYLCSAKVPTIGYGSTYYEDGRKVTLRDPPITIEVAEKLLELTVLKNYLPAVLRYCSNLKEPNHIAAILSFTYNLGPTALETSTLRKKVQEGDFAAVPEQLARWNRAGGKIVAGLVNRRADEIKVFNRTTV